MQTFFCDVPLCKNNFIAAQNASIFATIKMFLLRRKLYVIEIVQVCVSYHGILRFRANGTLPQNDNVKPPVISPSRSPKGARATAAEKSLIIDFFIRLRCLDSALREGDMTFYLSSRPKRRDLL